MLQSTWPELTWNTFLPGKQCDINIDVKPGTFNALVLKQSCQKKVIQSAAHQFLQKGSCQSFLTPNTQDGNRIWKRMDRWSSSAIAPPRLPRPFKLYLLRQCFWLLQEKMFILTGRRINNIKWKSCIKKGIRSVVIEAATMWTNNYKNIKIKRQYYTNTIYHSFTYYRYNSFILIALKLSTFTRQILFKSKKKKSVYQLCLLCMMQT